MPAQVPTRPGSFAIRRGLATAAPAAYVAVAALRAGEAAASTWLTLGAAIAVGFLAGASSGTARPAPDGPRPLDRARVAAGTALSIALATSLLARSPAWAHLLRDVAATAAGVVAARAFAAMEPEPGLSGRATDASAGPLVKGLLVAATALPVVTWGSLAASELVTWSRGHGTDTLARVATPVIGALSLVGQGIAATVLAGARRLELAAPPRLLACTGATAAGLLLACGLALLGPFHADPAVALGATASAVVVLAVARAGDALGLARVGRRTLTLALFGAPVVALGCIAGLAKAPGEGVVPLAIAGTALLVGAFARRLEEPFLPARGALLEALEEAREAARDREPRAAIASALARVRRAAGQGAESPELWLLYPTRVCAVDAAGYLREREAELPTLLLDAARGEPELTLRVDVLRALEVRRADLRPLLRWLDDRGALSATLVTDGEETDGVLIIPAGARDEPPTLEEAHRARKLADAFVTLVQAMSARERHLARERELKARIDGLEDELATVRHAHDLDVGRNVLASTRLARPATIGIYAAASRMAYEALERRIAQDAPVVLVARAGVDPVPYIARAHLSGPRKDAPLVIVDGTSSREHDVARWKDERSSPLALADRGLLVLVDGAALPRDVQVLVARSLAERRPPWERAAPLDVAVALTALDAPDVLLEGGRLAPELYARFETAQPIELPGLRERAEDLRAIVADRLAREGLRVRGRPVGIDAAAFARLVEHPFPGEDAELAALVTRLVARAREDVVRASDLDEAGIPLPDDEAALADAPRLTRRR